MSSVNPAPTTPMDNGPTGLPGGGRGGGKHQHLPSLPICSIYNPLSRQSDVKSLPLYIPRFVHPKTHPESPLIAFADHASSATLLLLLAISMLIVGRSVFIRRRTRRVLEEAARGGTTVPLQTVRSTVKLGAKPKLFDVYTTVHETPSRSPLDGGLLTWANLKVHPHLPVHSDQSIFTGPLQYRPASLCHIKKTGTPISPIPCTTIVYSIGTPFFPPFTSGSATSPIVSIRCPRSTCSPS